MPFLLASCLIVRSQSVTVFQSPCRTQDSVIAREMASTALGCLSATVRTEVILIAGSDRTGKETL